MKKILIIINSSNRMFLINDIYFWVYLIFLVLRIVIVFFSTANVFDASKNLLATVRNASTKDWGVDVS